MRILDPVGSQDDWRRFAVTFAAAAILVFASLLAFVLAVQLVAGPSVLLLDEPTRGLDYDAKARLAEVLRDLAADGRAVVVSTHDVEFVALACDRVVVLAEGEVVSDGPTRDVVLASPTFAPQVAKILSPQRWLTVEDVAVALSGAAS